MLSKAKRKLIRSLHTKKGRASSGLCLVEGKKGVDVAGDAIDFVFSRQDVESDAEFRELLTTDTPQESAAVARIPEWKQSDVEASSTIVVLDYVQDPGNVGTILRLCQAFSASLIMVETSDPSAPKVIRSASGAFFQVPWLTLSRKEAESFLHSIDRDIFRLEKTEKSMAVSTLATKKELVLIAGNEGNGIQLTTPGTSVEVSHEPSLESLNVATALAIALHTRYFS